MNRKKKESRNRFFLDTAVVLENPGFQFDYKIATKGGRNGHLEGHNKSLCCIKCDTQSYLTARSSSSRKVQRMGEKGILHILLLPL